MGLAVSGAVAAAERGRCPCLPGERAKKKIYRNTVCRYLFTEHPYRIEEPEIGYRIGKA